MRAYDYLCCPSSARTRGVLCARAPQQKAPQEVGQPRAAPSHGRPWPAAHGSRHAPAAHAAPAAREAVQPPSLDDILSLCHIMCSSCRRGARTEAFGGHVQDKTEIKCWHQAEKERVHQHDTDRNISIWRRCEGYETLQRQCAPRRVHLRGALTDCPFWRRIRWQLGVPTNIMASWARSYHAVT